MSSYSKIKNGLKITVKKWDNTITITDQSTNKIIGQQTFKDHIQAVTLAKAL